MWKFAHTKSEQNMVATFPYLHEVDKERERSCNIQPIDQMWIFFTRTRLGLFDWDLAHRYGISLSTVSVVLITWVNWLCKMSVSLPKDKIK